MYCNVIYPLELDLYFAMEKSLNFMLCHQPTKGGKIN